MMFDDDDDAIRYDVVVNHEEQYSIWPVDRDLPAGWTAEGTSGSRQECLAHIDEVWTDMRPLSLRRFMESAAAAPPPAPEPDPFDGEEPLVTRLSTGEHPVEISLRPERTPAALRAAMERGHVFVRFTGTRGGTELGVRLDRDASTVADADFDAGTGRIRVVGDLTLDFEPVRVTAEIDLPAMTGRGHLDLSAGAPPR
jgi:uncharacterized protein YbdZ (MbtH family)